MARRVDDFPWERFNAAQNYLYALKPWWRRFGERITWTPIKTPPPPGFRYGASSFVGSTGLTVYVDTAYAAEAPIHIIAGQVEHDLQVLVRKVNLRLRHVEATKPKQRSMAFELEINSSIKMEARENKLDQAIDPMRFSRLLNDSFAFTKKDAEKWGITKWPTISDSALTPDKLGLPDGLSAEEYFRLLDQEVDSPSASLNHEDNNPSGSDSSSDPLSLMEEPPDSGEQYQTENVESDPDSKKEAGSDAGGESGETEQDNLDDQVADQNPEDFSKSDSSPGDGDAPAQDLEPTQTLMDEVLEMMREDPMMDWSGQNHDNIEEMFKDDEEVELNEYEMSEALQDTADDIIGDDVPGFGLKPGNAMMNFTEVTFGKKSKSWERQISSMLVRSINSAKTQGAADFSYSVINHNQPQFGPILMGVHDYAPTIYIVLDISASMVWSFEKALNTVRDVVQEVCSKYGVHVTWITIDSKVRAVGKSMFFSKSDLDKIKKGGGMGGTDIKFLMMDIVNNKFTWEGRRYPRPDVLMVVTDCGFLWPWVTKRPNLFTKVIVASTIPHDRVVNRKGRVDFPQWIEPKKGNFVCFGK